MNNQRAHSATIERVAVFAGPGYWCAEGNIYTATHNCQVDPTSLDTGVMINAALYAENTETIDPTHGLRDARVWMQSGTKDTVVTQGVVNNTFAFYQHFTSAQGLRYLADVDSEHAWLSDSTDLNACDFLGTPYVNDCGFDAAGDLLKFIYARDFNERVPAMNYSNLYSFPQKHFIHADPQLISMGDQGIVYIPVQCMSGGARYGTCTLIVSLHGCKQSVDALGMQFVGNTGLNRYAESNDLVVLYPQATYSNDVPFNPEGCWDWWGYTNEAYATRDGMQISVIMGMVEHLCSK
jgi:hypothetical protein